jgi:hypothetical protein
VLFRSENPVLTGFISGTFPTSERDVVTESPLTKAVATVSRDVVMHLTPEGVVTAINPAVERLWGLRPADCVNVDLSLICTFPATVPDRLATNLGTTITITADQAVIPVNSYAFPLRRNETITGYVLFIEDMHEHVKEARELETELARAQELVQSIIPPPLRPKLVEANKSLTYVSNWAAVLCVQIAAFPDFAPRPNSVDVLKELRQAIADRVANVPGIVPIKSVGVSEYLLFNAAGEYGDADQTVPVIWAACTTLAEVAQGLGLQLQVGLSAEAQVVMGLMETDDLSFDVFGRVLRTARALAAKAPVNCLYVDKNVLPNFPTAVGRPQKPVSFKIGAMSYVAFECTLGAGA